MAFWNRKKTDSAPGTGEGLDLSRLPRHVGIIMDGQRPLGQKAWPAPHGRSRSRGGELPHHCLLLQGPGHPVPHGLRLFYGELEAANGGSLRHHGPLAELSAGGLGENGTDGFRVHFFGDLEGLPPKLRDLCLRTLEEGDALDGTRFQVNVCLNYGGRDEILRAVRRFAAECAEGKRKPEDLDETLFSTYLDSAGIPDPELIIRPSGEQRLSNFLLWQCAYSEFYYTDTLWPDFDEEELDKAIAAYQSRDRRFGGVKK